MKGKVNLKRPEGKVFREGFAIRIIHQLLQGGEQ